MAAAAWPSDPLHRNRIGGFQVTRFSALVAETGWNADGRRLLPNDRSTPTTFEDWLLNLLNGIHPVKAA